MSRSYRKPYAAITGVYTGSADDKRIARRAVRRKQNFTLRNCTDYEELLVPHRYECSFNDVWSWGRDGKQHYRVPDDRDWSRYCLTHLPDSCMRWSREFYSVWPPKWYTEITRK